MRNLNIPLHTENEPRVENGTTTERKKTSWKMLSLESFNLMKLCSRCTQSSDAFSMLGYLNTLTKVDFELI